MSWTLIAAALAVQTVAVATPGPGVARARLPAAGDDAERQLRREADRLRTGHASKLFADLIDPDWKDTKRKLSPAQSEMVRQLDRLACDVQIAWLLRGLDRDPPPSADALKARLSAHDGLRARVVAHAEAIALDAVLDPEQARRRAAGRPKSPPAVERYPPIPEPSDGFPSESRADFDGTIRNFIARLKHPEIPASDLFKIAEGGIFVHHPGTHRAVSEPMHVAPEQVELLRRLDILARNVQAAWLAQGLDAGWTDDTWEDLPPTPRMVDRLSARGDGLRARVVAHAEAIALDAVLDPEQGRESRRHLWAARGVRSLLDPELAAELRLSQPQRHAIAELLEARAVDVHRIRSVLGKERVDASNLNEANQLPQEQKKASDARLVDDAYREVQAVDRPIWAVLKAQQVRAFERLIARPEARVPPLPDRSK